MDNEDKIQELHERLDVLTSKQSAFLKEIRAVREELKKLKFNDNQLVEVESVPLKSNVVKQEQPSKTSELLTKKTPWITQLSDDLNVSFNFEKFVGENLISKLGILITIIGVVIGAKYSIENGLISPLTRIILGYLVGLGLLGFGIQLKTKYENYSSVLVSGAIAIMYFITFAAYSFYGLIPQLLAFTLMVLFTIFTVIAALNYNKQVIAHIGLVGAYAVPFFLSNGSGDMLSFFIYISIMNIGILVIAFRKYWKPLYYLAFLCSWVIYFFWFDSSYQKELHYGIALSFAALFFIIFYITFLSYKILKQEQFNISDVVLVIVNSSFYYGVTYTLLNSDVTGSTFLGLFTLGNAVVHFAVSTLIFKQKLYDKQLFFLVLGLVLVFITIAIPVQLDGNWVTLLWSAEAALLFWIGRTKAVPFYEKVAYALMALAFISIIQDWYGYDYYRYYLEANEKSDFMPLLNIYFLTSLFFIASFGVINYLHQNEKYVNPLATKRRRSAIINYGLPAVLLISIYVSFHVEITHYFSLLYENSKIKISTDDSEYSNYEYNYNIIEFQRIWLINYTLVFLAILSFFNITKIKNRNLGIVNLGLNIFAITVFLLGGIETLNNLQSAYFYQTANDFFTKNAFYVIVKYISFAFLGLLIFACYKYIYETFMKVKMQIMFDLLLHISILTIICTEFIAWMEVAEYSTANELGLTIIWGLYALIIIGLGIWKNKKHLRIGAIALFGLTLLKLFSYDISHLNTISKTIVLVALGILLLIISFLYNKYKHIIFDEDEK